MERDPQVEELLDRILDELVGRVVTAMFAGDDREAEAVWRRLEVIAARLRYDGWSG